MEKSKQIKVIKNPLVAVAVIILVFAVVYLAGSAVIKAAIPAAKNAAELATQELTAVEDFKLEKGIDSLYTAEGGRLVMDETVQGFLGEIGLTLGLDSEGKVDMVVVNSQNETPEKGGVVLSNLFLSGVLGAESSEGLDAMSGATITSNALFKAIDSAKHMYNVYNGLEEPAPEEVPAVPAAPSGSYTAGTYSSDQETAFSTVSVEMTFSDTEITDAKVTSSGPSDLLNDSQRYSWAEQIVSSQGAEVDTISGVTFSSNAVKDAVADILSQANAAASAPSGNYATGTYTSDQETAFSTVSVEMTFSDTEITDAKVTSSGPSDLLNDSQRNSWAEQIVSSQGAEVDTISGVTFSSNAVKDAVADILSQASSAEAEVAEEPAETEETAAEIEEAPSEEVTEEEPVVEEEPAAEEVPAEEPAEEPEEAVEPAAEAEAAAEDVADELLPLEGVELLENVSAAYTSGSGRTVVDETVKGLFGDIALTIGVDPEGKVDEITVGANNETPGLGGAVLSEDFYSKYIGADSAEGVDAMTGATITSNALKSAVETALNQFAALSSEDTAPEAEEAEADEETEAAPEEDENELKALEGAELLENVAAVYTSKAGRMVADETVKGLFGDIALSIGVNSEGKIDEITVGANNETPGLGGAVLSEDFYIKYIGADSAEGVDAMTGATITSNALKSAIETALKQFAALPEEAAEIVEVAEGNDDDELFPVSGVEMVDGVSAVYSSKSGRTVVDETVRGCSVTSL